MCIQIFASESALENQLIWNRRHQQWAGAGGQIVIHLGGSLDRDSPSKGQGEG